MSDSPQTSHKIMLRQTHALPEMYSSFGQLNSLQKVQKLFKKYMCTVVLVYFVSVSA